MGLKTRIINMKPSSYFDSHIMGPGVLYNSYLAYKATNKRKKTRVGARLFLYFRLNKSTEISMQNVLNYVAIPLLIIQTIE